MKLENRKLATIILIAVLTISFALVNAVPGIPHKFYGTVIIDGYPAPDGTDIDALIDGVIYEWTTTSGGLYGMDGLFSVPADDSDTSNIEGGVNGDLIDFAVDGEYAGSFTFTSGAITNLDLEITTATYTIELWEGWNLIGIPFIPDNPDIEVMLLHILDYVEVVWSYDAETWTWSSYSPWVPPMLNDLTEMTDGKGYWIYMNTDVIWELG